VASPPAVIDRSILALRRGGPALVARAFAAGGLVGWVVLLVYYFEEVEGVRTLRPLFGALLALAFWGRAFLLAGVARRIVLPLVPTGATVAPMRFVDVARTASVVAIGLFFWLWLPVVGSYVGGALMATLLLPLGLRGAVAPTWIARAGVAPEGGLGAFRRAFEDLGRERMKGATIELLVLLAGMAIFVNLVAATAIIGLLGRSFLGLDVADIETFFSTENTFVLLSLAVVAAVALEPLRASISAVLYVEARARREGFDLEAAVQSLDRSRARAGALVVFAVVVGLAGLAGTAAAQPTTATLPADLVAGDPPGRLGDRDWAVQKQIERTLARSEFEEHGGVAPGRTLRELVERLVEWLLKDRDPDLDLAEGPPLAMPPGWVFGLVFVVLVAILLVVGLRARGAITKAGPPASPPSEPDRDPRDRAPADHLDDAARLAAEGAHREAFRALYLATLVALDRRGAIAFDRSRTNWHYLRSMASGPTREAFHRFTALFDRKWYGDEATTDVDYRLGRELADHLCIDDADRAEGAAR
jgi:hypothetical protein